MKKVIESFEIEYLQILNEEGNIDESLYPELGLSDDQIKEMYKFMVLSKKFDESALSLQREGRLGTYASGRGQEAAQVGPIFALEKKDFIFPAFRENTAFITRNMPMHKILQYWGGDERGEIIPEGVNMFPVSIVVGSHPLHSVGYAWAAKLKKDPLVTLAFFGDGATSEGDFHEAMNFAGVFKTPSIFICQNNQWAISLPRSGQTASKTIAQKAIAYGFSGIQVDGNDIFAMYKATKDAAKKAREGKGPTLIEAYTYRLSDHTTADDSKKYRNEQEVQEWAKKDPLTRLKLFMEKRGFWNSEQEEKLQQEVSEKVKLESDKYLSFPKASFEDMFKYTYAEMTQPLKEQLEELKKSIAPKDTPTIQTKTVSTNTSEEPVTENKKDTDHLEGTGVERINT